MVPLASTTPVLVCIINPPHGCELDCGMKTTGRSTVPLTSTEPLFVMCTAGFSNTKAPAPTAEVEPAGIAMWPVTRMRALSGQLVVPERVPETEVQDIEASMLIVLFVCAALICGR